MKQRYGSSASEQNTADPQRVTHQFAQLDELMPLIRERLACGQRVKLSPMGVSMLPMLREGRDSVELSAPPERLKKYDLPLYRRADGKYILHRVIKVGERYTCMGDNQTVAEFGIAHEQVIAVVTAFTRDGKSHSVREMGYQFYCGFWHHTRFPRRAWRGIKRRLKRLIGRA